MGGRKARERLEEAEKVARKTWKNIGVEHPTDAQVAFGILQVLEEWGNEIKKAKQRAKRKAPPEAKEEE